MTTEERHQLKEKFIKNFPLESLKNMTLEQYTNVNRSDSFCYWIESKTKELGSVWGGSSYKFGIYHYIKRPNKNQSGSLFDDKYAWNSSLGETAEEAFAKIKTTIIHLAEYGRDGNLKAIEAIKEFWPVIKWKIAFLYSNDTIIPYFSVERIKIIAELKGMDNAKSASVADIQRFLIDKKGGKDIFGYGKMLDDIWKEYERKTNSNHGTPKKEIEKIQKTSKQDLESRYKYYIDLLNNNKNLILTGAPGTGKTYLAKAIAKEMDAEIGFVQFHPSYDYTDFVEGLRPISPDDTDRLGFELRNGVFKEFCINALKSKEGIPSFKKIYKNLLSKIHEGEIETLVLKTGKQSQLLRARGDSILFVNPSLDKYDEANTVTWNRLSKLLDNGYKSIEKFNNIKNIDKEVRYVIGGCNSTNYWAVLNYLLNNSKDIIDEKKVFVFIIDEINRGEISKIFGELFFSIDPGYRGEEGRVTTQYQNMIEDGDVFKDGFFVPQNVYIIGTMNDIDRSVESMDFAMRRRFAWQEVTAEDSYVNMIEDDPKFAIVKKEIKRRMFNLNKAISETEGLDDSYQIGAAYFRKYLDYKDMENPFNYLWENHLKGLLNEYLRGNRRAKELLEGLQKAYNSTDEQ